MVVMHNSVYLIIILVSGIYIDFEHFLIRKIGLEYSTILNKGNDGLFVPDFFSRLLYIHKQKHFLFNLRSLIIPVYSFQEKNP